MSELLYQLTGNLAPSSWTLPVTAAPLMKGTGPSVREWLYYLAVVLDKFSRRVVGWALDRNLTSRLSLTALRSALEHRKPAPGLVHHSDRGPQYIHAGYLRTLRKYGMVPSVSRPGNPGDNANCESFFRTLKREELEAREYADLEDLRLNISQFIDRYYNEERLHSALGYRSPAEFERITGGPREEGISSDVELREADRNLESPRELQKSDSSVTMRIVSTRGSHASAK